MLNLIIIAAFFVASNVNSQSYPMTLVYRYYNRNTNDHLLTTDPDELGGVDGTPARLGYVYEGIAFEVYLQETSLFLPVYRFYKNPLHYYTRDRFQYGSDYVYEGILGYVGFNSAYGQNQLVKLLYVPIPTLELITANPNERPPGWQVQANFQGWVC